MNGAGVQHDGLKISFAEDQAITTAEHKNFSTVHTYLSGIAAAFFSFLFALLGQNLGALNRRPSIGIALIAVPLALIFFAIILFLMPRIQNWRIRRALSKADIAFIVRKESEMRGLLSEFRQFAARSNIRSVGNLASSALAEDKAAFATLIESDYAENWADFLRVQLEQPSTSLKVFQNRSREFSGLVNQFILTDLLPAQKIFAGSRQPYSDSFLNALDHLQAGFNIFIRDLEIWAKAVHEYTLPRLGFHSPNISFKRVDSFRPTRSKSAGA